ncbi:hypothetical protein Cgig2_025639 [Carnegiea gigantea]|uniref:RNase H type-1 domain-containing protein n=1 Tax=Carnegiea gigantea TaxID=171969 RepID=A0A9Q1JVH1_9CARY|nr:hypothetical protein Cgig2_025639 [Carnegiea gigantea]
MKQTTAAAWRPPRGVFIREIGENLFLFRFYHEMDVRRVLDGGPWSFDQCLLVLQECRGGDQPSHMVLDTVSFWVQVYDLAFNSRDEEVVRLVAGKIGKVVEVDREDYGMYIRVRVELNVNMPWKRGMKLREEDGGWIWIRFKCERLPTFCYVCGCMGHCERESKLLLNYPELANGERQYGAWLRAPIGRRQVGAHGGDRWLLKAPVTNMAQQTGYKRPQGQVSNFTGGRGNCQHSSQAIISTNPNSYVAVNNVGEKTSGDGVSGGHAKQGMEVTCETSGIGEVESGPEHLINSHGPTTQRENIEIAGEIKQKRQPIKRMKSGALITAFNSNIMSIAKPLQLRQHSEEQNDDVIMSENNEGALGSSANANSNDQPMGSGDRTHRRASHDVGEELPVRVASYSRNHIDLVFLDERGVDRWRLTGYYAFPEKERRREAWDFLRDRAMESSLPWFIVGDFNDIVQMHEKTGQSDRNAWMLSGFREAVNDCRLIDLGFSSYPCTWNNRRSGNKNVEERLDKGMATSEFMDIHPQLKVKHVGVSRRQWDIDILNQLFVREEVDEVLRIPLPDNMEKDEIIWWQSKDGMYTVKGGYWLALEDQVEQAKMTEQENIIWDQIWGANVPRVVKDFLWRGCINVIPCRTRLFERGIDVSTVCDFCGTVAETLIHIIWTCPLAHSLRTHVSCPLPFITDYFVSFKDWVQSAVDTLPQMEMAWVFMCAWKLWTHRNERVWQGEEKGPLLLIAEADSYIQDFWKANDREELIKQKSCEQQWQKLGIGEYKINSDAAIDKDSGRTGFGAVIRNSEGLVIACFMKSLRGVLEPRSAEALGIKWAILCTKDIGLSGGIYETDCMDVVGELQQASRLLTSFQRIVYDVKHASLYLSAFSLNHVRRSANRVAHLLVREALKEDGFRAWIEDCPPCVLDLVMLEQN